SDPVIAYRPGRRVKQGLTDALEPFRGRLGEARANGSRVAGTVLAHRRNSVCLATRDHQLRRLRLGARSPTREPLLQPICSVRLDQRVVVNTEFRAGKDRPPAWLAVPEARCAPGKHCWSNSCGKITAPPPAQEVVARTYVCARGGSTADPAAGGGGAAAEFGASSTASHCGGG